MHKVDVFEAPTIRRRTIMLTAVATAAGTAATLPAHASSAAEREVAYTQPVHVTVNDKAVKLEVEPRSSLLDVLREQLALTGTKKGCDHGQCGACTVHLDGRRVAACLTLAVKTEGRAVTTIEGIEFPNGDLHPMQQAFLDHDGLQCGYCTPGQVMAAIACVREGHAKGELQIREYMSGNLCRCGAYAGILNAIKEVAPTMLRMEAARRA